MGIKSAKHHWWPQCVSKRWRDARGKLYQLHPDGKVIPHANSKEYGAIRDAHTVKLSDTPTSWDVSFENNFQNADSIFPKLLDTLEKAPYKSLKPNTQLVERFTGLDVAPNMISELEECFLSLIVRSPMFRNHRHLFNLAIQGRNGIEIEKIDKKLVNINLQYALPHLKKSLGQRGKYALLFSKTEFIFGDGFYSNILSTHQMPPRAFAIVPFLPNLAVLFHCPTQYASEPQLVTIEISEEEAKSINEGTMIYSKDSVFYRSEKPTINDSFKQRRFQAVESYSPYLIEFLHVFTRTHFPKLILK